MGTGTSPIGRRRYGKLIRLVSLKPRFQTRFHDAGADLSHALGPYSMGIGNAAAWLGMPVIAPEAFETIASKLESQDHAAQLPPDTDPTVIAGESLKSTLKKEIS